MDRPDPSTNRVRLRDVVEDDLLIFYEQQLDPEATQMANFPARERRAFLAHWQRILADASVDKQTILFDGQVAGNIVCFEQFGERHIGYWIGRPYWGKGIASEALAGFLRQVKTRPLYARVAKHNAGSMRVLEKCGFTITGEDKYVNESGVESEEYILRLG